MKIRKLLTLSQFVDLAVKEISIKTGINLPKDINSSNVDDWNTKSIHALGYIRKYNYFLKQPLSKEMFVNPYGQPEKEPKGFLRSREAGEKLWEQWQEAEKKVLFDGKIGWCEDMLDVFEIEGVEIFYNHHTKQWYTSDEEKTLNSLHDLAEATKGELTLKNVEL